ncbi:MAG: hypothetical protein ABR555_14500 [Pyrinomonadaceae bacterium]
MKKLLLILTTACLLLTAAETHAVRSELPNPVIMFTHAEAVTIGGKDLTRYYFDVDNKEAYPAELFAADLTLPPCGNNKNASRTWIDIYEQNGTRLNGFCNIKNPKDLNQLWFALDRDAIPPSWIYVVFTDRRNNTKYKSNLADTTN